MRRVVLIVVLLAVAGFVLLDHSRNVFAHNATTYAAVDLSEEGNDRYDLLTMQEKLHSFADEEKFIRLSYFPRIL